MKKLFLIPIILVITFFSGCRKAPENYVTPPFFKVTDESTGGVVYLLGTMHVGVENTIYPDGVYAAVDECELLAVEVDLQALESNRAELSAALKILECKDETAADFLGDDYSEIKDFFVRQRIYSAALDRYIPVMWTSTLTNKIAGDCGYSSQYGTERVLLSYAKKRGFDVYELESVAEQYQMNANEPRELQCYILKYAVETDLEIQMEQMNELYRAWSEGSFDALEQMILEDLPPEEYAEQYAEYYTAMYEDRQRKMAEYAVQTLKNGGKAFIAVGAMHFFAAPDILDFIEAEGYTIERL